MKIVVTNAVSLNGGDAAILTAEHDLLRAAFPGADVTAIDSQAEVAARLYPEFRFEQHLYEGTRQQRFRKARRNGILSAARRLASGRRPGFQPLLSDGARRTLDAYAKADLVVSTGGTYLVEHYELTQRFFELEIAAAFGAPLVFFTQSLGPFKKPENIARLRPLFDRASLVLLRDQRSARHLAEIGVPSNHVHVHGDAAFALGSDRGLERLRNGMLPARGARVAISVRHWTHFSSASAEEGMRRYQATLAALVEHLVRERGAEVTFVSTCQGIPEYWTNDARTAASIVALLPSDVRAQVEVDAAFHRPEALIERFAASDLLIATRMHAAILALVAGTPVLPIAYETKTSELFATLGQADLVLELEELSPDRALGACATLYRELASRRAALADAVSDQRTSARAVVDRLRSLSPLSRRAR